MAAYKDLVGQKITKVTSNPGEPKTGQMWYNSTDGKLRGLGILEAWSSASPLIVARDKPGNAGTQTLTVAVRAMATRELNCSNSVRIFGKEILVGIYNGLFFAFLIGISR